MTSGMGLGSLADLLGVRVVVSEYIPPGTIVFMGENTVIVGGIAPDGPLPKDEGWLLIYRRWA